MYDFEEVICQLLVTICVVTIPYLPLHIFHHFPILNLSYVHLKREKYGGTSDVNAWYRRHTITDFE